jgi:hypothetical protein
MRRRALKVTCPSPPPKITLIPPSWMIRINKRSVSPPPFPPEHRGIARRDYKKPILDNQKVKKEDDFMSNIGLVNKNKGPKEKEVFIGSWFYKRINQAAANAHKKQSSFEGRSKSEMNGPFPLPLTTPSCLLQLLYCQRSLLTDPCKDAVTMQYDWYASKDIWTTQELKESVLCGHPVIPHNSCKSIDRREKNFFLRKSTGEIPDFMEKRKLRLREIKDAQKHREKDSADKVERNKRRHEIKIICEQYHGREKFSILKTIMKECEISLVKNTIEKKKCRSCCKISYFVTDNDKLYQNCSCLPEVLEPAGQVDEDDYIDQQEVGDLHNNDESYESEQEMQLNEIEESSSIAEISDDSSITEIKMCVVCGDESVGLHFGVDVCTACRSFFQKTLTDRCEERYKCHSNRDCQINAETRNNCDYCYYRKCLRKGMNQRKVGPLSMTRK